jgi:hypothetical protein
MERCGTRNVFQRQVQQERPRKPTANPRTSKGALGHPQRHSVETPEGTKGSLRGPKGTRGNQRGQSSKRGHSFTNTMHVPKSEGATPLQACLLKRRRCRLTFVRGDSWKAAGHAMFSNAKYNKNARGKQQQTREPPKGLWGTSSATAWRPQREPRGA